MSGPWWREAVVYQVYVRSFADSDGDGIGDLPGITAHLDHLASLGVDAVWLTPFYRSPMHDHGYDVADPRDVDPLFGTLADADALLEHAHALGLRVIVDIVPNHVSVEHPWWLDAITGRDSAMRDRFVFRDAGPEGEPPNNWTAIFGGPAWDREPNGDQLYLHLFAPGQPDLNWRNPAVHDYWDGVLHFWLDRGVDGFRIDVAHGLYKDAELRSHDVPDVDFPGRGQLATMMSPYCWDQPEVHDVYRRWRSILDSYSPDRMAVGEVFLLDVPRVAGYVGPDRLNQAFNFVVMQQELAAPALRRVIGESLQLFAGSGSLPTWVLSNHDLVRHASRYGGGDAGRERGLALTALLLALPGSPYIYQGEELGLEQVAVPVELRTDPMFTQSGGAVEGRDGARTPMPWTGEAPSFGFTTGPSTWLPFNADAASRNVAAQTADPGSTLATYRTFLARRRALLPDLGDTITFLDAPEDVIAIWREGSPGLVVVMNASDEPRAVPGVTGRPIAHTGPFRANAHGITYAPRSTTWLAVEDAGA
ncbi:MAG TPA: alpha-amylase family glycosyl hydrolase [Mycobacteriales bacterium]|nr:alpha-amylase family glycosyl hydrolase [Mycobacteriales bacterium]